MRHPTPDGNHRIRSIQFGTGPSFNLELLTGTSRRLLHFDRIFRSCRAVKRDRLSHCPPHVAADGMTSLAFCPKRTPPRPRPPEAALAVSRVLAKSSIQIYGMGSGEREEAERERERERGSHGRGRGRFHRIGDRRTEEITAEGERTAGRPGRRGRLRAKYLPWGLWEHKGEGRREAREEEGPSPRGGQSERPTEWPAAIGRREGKKGRPRGRPTDRPSDSGIMLTPSFRLLSRN